MSQLDPAACYRAIASRDARFDGRLFVGVRTTEIYCRPICPAPTPKAENCRYFPSAAAAQESGFRPCLRCRPETSPGLGVWRGTSNTVSRALTLIAEGGLDGETGNVAALSERLGVGERQLRRLFKQHLGAPPVAVAQTRRVQFAKQLLDETRLPMTEIAFASGFGSVRRFNDAFRRLYARPPGALRRGGSANGARGIASIEAGVTLFARYRPPYDWLAMLAWLAARCVPGVEAVMDGAYRRTVAHDGRFGTVAVAHAPDRTSLRVAIHLPSLPALHGVMAQVRRVFDVSADPESINAHLSKDALLAPLVARRPGLRAPGGWDDFEIAVRAALGEQLALEEARALAGCLVVLCGAEMPVSGRIGDGLTLAFPTPARIAATDLAPLDAPQSRKATLKALAEAALADPGLFRRCRTVEEATDRLRAIPGVGASTAQCIALQALHECDAFPVGDMGLLRAAARAGRPPRTPSDLIERAETWRPWRAYAAQHLWTDEAAA